MSILIIITLIILFRRLCTLDQNLLFFFFCNFVSKILNLKASMNFHDISKENKQFRDSVLGIIFVFG